MNNAIKNMIMKNNVASNDRTNTDITIRKKSLRTIPDSSLLDNVGNPRSIDFLYSRSN